MSQVSASVPPNGSLWRYKQTDRVYRVLFITNTAHTHLDHPPQVVYEGTHNGSKWSQDIEGFNKRFTPTRTAEWSMEK